MSESNHARRITDGHPDATLIKPGYMARTKIDLNLRPPVSMTPRQALALIRATKAHEGKRSKVISAMSLTDALDAYMATIAGYLEEGEGQFVNGREIDKPMLGGMWKVARNIMVDCLGMDESFPKGGEGDASS